MARHSWEDISKPGQYHWKCINCGTEKKKWGLRTTYRGPEASTKWTDSRQIQIDCPGSSKDFAFKPKETA